ncbi:G patch domain and KOW motifs-containing protein [Myotis davidii]|uniref:G patch domain and KOW motifs-containing protein n=1 Tax=Myotis davidii TaxID=225400 RepID=L5LG30_MYODS|nr:G patch domain and KOW motifs-containing protein [Myotis davidii]
MLRGMGCKPGWGIGHTFNQMVKPHVNSLRPKGLRLGINLAEVQALTPTTHRAQHEFDKHFLEPSQVSKTPSSGQLNRTALLQKAFQGPDPPTWRS